MRLLIFRNFLSWPWWHCYEFRNSGRDNRGDFGILYFITPGRYRKISQYREPPTVVPSNIVVCTVKFAVPGPLKAALSLFQFRQIGTFTNRNTANRLKMPSIYRQTGTVKTGSTVYRRKLYRRTLVIANRPVSSGVKKRSPEDYPKTCRLVV